MRQLSQDISHISEDEFRSAMQKTHLHALAMERVGQERGCRAAWSFDLILTTSHHPIPLMFRIPDYRSIICTHLRALGFFCSRKGRRADYLFVFGPLAQLRADEIM